MANMFFCFTISRHEDVVRKFQRNHLCKNDGVYFLSSMFDSKDACLDFAVEIEGIKADHNEFNYIIKCTKDPAWNPFVAFKPWEYDRQ